MAGGGDLGPDDAQPGGDRAAPRAARHGLTAHGVWFNAQGAVRAPWRLAVFFLVFAVFAIVFSQVGVALFGLGPASSAQSFGQFVLATAMTLALLVAHLVAVRWVDRGSWADIGMARDDARPRLLASGTLLGALAVGIPGAMLLGIGWLDVVPGAPGSWWTTALALGMLYVPAALAEELLFRGYPFAVLRSAVGPAIALVATSVVFAAVHVSNQAVMSDTSALPQGILAVFLAGLLLGGIVLVTGSVWAAWAAHFAWNFVLGVIIRSPVSGISEPVTRYALVDDGPDWATGGGWGPEGGAFAMAGMLAAMAILYMLPRRTQRGGASRAAGPGEAGA